MLDIAAAREHVHRSLDTVVRSSYGASEFLPMAWECAHGHLHLNEDWLILEPVDEHQRPVPPGQPSCSVLLTNLANTVQPLIRYDLGDQVTLGERAFVHYGVQVGAQARIAPAGSPPRSCWAWAPVCRPGRRRP